MDQGPNRALNMIFKKMVVFPERVDLETQNVETRLNTKIYLIGVSGFLKIWTRGLLKDSKPILPNFQGP